MDTTTMQAQGGLAFPISEFRLDNGLHVILLEDRSAPTVAVDVWYKVGGANDPPGRSGFAHLFEHMMFQGSANVPRGAHSDLITAAGGNDNATTGLDRTNYFDTLPAHQLPLALWLEADRMASLVVDEANFDREREVVKEEFRLRVNNQPYGEAVLRLQTLPFDYPPYQQPVIGSIEDLDRSTVDQVREFHATYYKPSNAVLVVAGDFDLSQTTALIEELFAPIPRREPPPELPPYAQSYGRTAKEVDLQDKLAHVPAAFVVYAVPPRRHPSFRAADLLSRILGHGESSRLARALIDTGLAAEASTYLAGNRGPSLLAVTLIPNHGIAVGEIEQLYYDEVEQIRSSGVDGDELTKAVNQIRAERTRGLQTALGLAEQIHAASFYLGDPRALFDELERYRTVTSADIQRVANAYLASDKQTIIRVAPESGVSE